MDETRNKIWNLSPDNIGYRNITSHMLFLALFFTVRTNRIKCQTKKESKGKIYKRKTQNYS